MFPFLNGLVYLLHESLIVVVVLARDLIEVLLYLTLKLLTVLPEVAHRHPLEPRDCILFVSDGLHVSRKILETPTIDAAL